MATDPAPAAVWICPLHGIVEVEEGHFAHDFCSAVCTPHAPITPDTLMRLLDVVVPQMEHASHGSVGQMRIALGRALGLPEDMSDRYVQMVKRPSA